MLQIIFQLGDLLTRTFIVSFFISKRMFYNLQNIQTSFQYEYEKDLFYHIVLQKLISGKLHSVKIQLY